MVSNTLLSKLDSVYHSAIRFVTKAPYTLPTTATCMFSLASLCFIFVAKSTGSRSSMSLLGKALPYFSSLVTIATPTRSTHSSRYISLVIPKANSSFGPLSFQFSAANDWKELQKSLKLETYISLNNF
jgi:ABC-type Fe3+-siderophore transport system permease subunit